MRKERRSCLDRPVLALFAAVALLVVCCAATAALAAPPGFDPEAKVLNIFTPLRLKLTAEYSQEHYGTYTADLKQPKMIVLHYTAFHTFDDSYKFFLPPYLDTEERADISSGGLVNVSAHYLVDRDGTIYQLASEDVICRHVIGFNYTAIGIENVGDGADDLTPAQARANAALVNRIVKRHPSIEYLIGHQQYQNSNLPHFKLYLEKDRSYQFTPKQDPGFIFLKRVRKLLRESYGIVLKN
ncbi:peptidoglycan recognition protein family protein [Geomesophilobacter sediminis]|uniref:N-acetylmuramoyl-L-alanine amidase n=1 Tax=Geomesophilobacter sediminis TaxID=2798584 RepID=A0A8J7M036_9BACT|nr:peptidoglycan recognition family protein [Geomesophilobacter sediminis]MBJ6723132.1 N-acetylmuramoyl-L-alanine amidase [Geomesophilobacter sediminis]